MNEIWLIIGMALVTFIPRLLPFALANKLRLPKSIEQGLSYVPIAILSVIIVQTVFYRDGVMALHASNPFLWASLAAVITALVQRRLFITILFGLLSYALLKFWLLT